MAFIPTRRLVNPRLGPYFAIFTSSFVSIILLALMGEQLGFDKGVLRWAVFGVPLAIYAVIGIAAATRDPLEYFAAGRRVPAVYSGLTLAVSAFGGTGLVAVTGTLFLVGFDALCLVIGGLAGFVVMGILLAPFFRKFGAYTIPTYLGRRFDSPPLRLVSAIIVCIPLALVLVAELKMAAFAGAFLTGAAPALVLCLLVAVLVVTLAPGGMRSVTWTSVAYTIAALLALVIPVAIVAVLWTNLPLAQLSHGPLMRVIARQEAAQGLPLVLAQGFTFDLPGEGITPVVKRYAAIFGAVGPAGFVAVMLTIMMGVAAAPWLLPRIATSPGVYHARKSLGWATVVFGFVMLTDASIAVFLRAVLLEGSTASGGPEWVRQLAAMGFAEIDAKAAAVASVAGEPGRAFLPTVGLARDAILFALPMAAGLSGVLVALAVAGAVAACLTAAASAAAALAATVAEDIWHGAKAEPPPDAPRLMGARVCLVAVLIGAGVAAASLPGDPLELMLCALALTASALFPVLVMSIWWKRTNAFGAVAGLVSGCAVTLIAILAGSLEILPFDPALSAIFGFPAALITTIATSLATPQPGRHVLELVRDIRVPGGEILYDREMRLLRLKKRQRTAEPL